MGSFLFQEAERYDVRGKKYFEDPSRCCCADPGLRNAGLNFRQQEETHGREDILFHELLHRGCSAHVGAVELREQSEGRQRKRQCGTGFVASRLSVKSCIQAALNAEEPSRWDAELRPRKSIRGFHRKIPAAKTAGKPWTDEDGILISGSV